MEKIEGRSFSRSGLFRKTGLFLFILMCVSVLSLYVGPAGTDFGIIMRVRLPRVVLGIIVGGTLAMSGAVFQGVLRNPLADPYILGTSTGGALGASVGLILLGSSGVVSSLVIPILAFSGSFLTTIIVYLMSRRGGRVPRETLLLSGVIVGTLFGAIIMFLMTWAEKELHEILYVLMGYLGMIWTGETLYMVVMVTAMVIAGGFLIYYHARDLNLLSLGEEQAFSLGVDVERTKLYLFFSASLITGSVVSLSGLIGFVGLVVPHIVRMALGTDNRILIPASFLAGSTLLIVSDTVARSLFIQEIPVGVVTALFGTPFFIYLLRREGKTEARG
ncbi:MAG: FecCD family ABC transporter permease [Candidatus Glassbacteria bacterium]